jgi:formylglycine-generating enzyme required for sulfatase activity
MEGGIILSRRPPMTGQESKQEEDNEKTVKADDQSLAVGDIRVGGNTGNISISNVTHIYNTLEKDASSKLEAPVEGEPPYMGLRYFDVTNADLFFGREALTRELVERVSKESFLAIVGASGSGKSSIARAGLIPAWQKENEHGAIHVIVPTEHPLESLAASLTRDSESVTATSTLMDDIQRDARSLRLYAKKLLSKSGNSRMLLVVDQFEETFTLCKDLNERKAFIENLLSLAEEDNNTAHAVITLRADFYHHCAEYEGLRLMLEKHQAYIGPMTQDELRDAITAPAEKNGWDFQPGLIDLILQDVGTEPGALPLLSHALLETWKRRQRRTLTLQGYHEAGGVKKAITQTAENVYDKLSPAEQTVARNIFLRLTELGEGVQDTRRRVKMEELAQAQEQEAVAKVLKTLTDARLVTTEQDSAEVAHEALIREWGTLRKWLDENREGLRLHRHLSESAWEWQRRGREASELYRGARLRQSQEWMKEHGGLLSPLEAEFVKASQNVNRKERFRLATLASVGAMLLLLAVLGVTGRLNYFIYHPVDMENYWVTIPAGKFLMGSSDADLRYAKGLCANCDFSHEQPQHTVYLDKYLIGRYEITNRQYAQCVKAGICGEKSSFAEDRALHPVTNVTWDDAVRYCQWVGGYLPTEAEWEKAASWDDITKTKYIYPWGNKPPTAELLSYNGSIYDTTPVGKYASGASPYGLYGMAGNIWEWVNDSYSDMYYQSLRPSNSLGPENGQVKVLRGGSWLSFDYIVRSAYRYGYYRVSYSSLVGFRCAHSP